MSFYLTPISCKKCGKRLTLFEGQICLECEKTEDKKCENCKYSKMIHPLLKNYLACKISHEVNQHVTARRNVCDKYEPKTEK